MVYAYALFCLVATPTNCAGVEVGQKQQATCQADVQSFATTWLSTHSGYGLSRNICFNVPLEPLGLQAMFGPYPPPEVVKGATKK